jgi:hypothetical protein
MDPLVELDLLIIETSLSHTDTTHSVGFFWKSDHTDLSTGNNHNRQISIPQAGFDLAIPASERPQTHTHALDRAAIGVGNFPTDNLNNETRGIRFFLRC